MHIRRFMLIVAAGLALAAPSFAADLTFTAQLGGDKPTTNTGSKATGVATVVVHEATQTVDVTVKVAGIAPKDFAQHLAHAPVGPMHLHLYEPNGNVSLLLPFPMSDAYKAADGGFTYARTGYAYAEGAKILQSTVPFDGFVAAMKSGAVVFNIHTTTFPDGEISGTMTPAP